MKLKKYLAVSLLLSSMTIGAQAQNTIFNQEQKAEIEAIVHNYLLENPEIIIEVAKKLEQKQQDQYSKKVNEVASYFLDSKDTPSFGAKDAKHYIIEFYDYNCTYCKTGRDHLKKAIERGDVRLLTVEIPILGESSLATAQIGVYLFSQDKAKYKEYQDALMTVGVKIKSIDDLKNILSSLNLSYDDMEKAFSDKKVVEVLSKNLEMAQKVELQGTPFFIIDGKVVRGAISSYQMLESYLK